MIRVVAWAVGLAAPVVPPVPGLGWARAGGRRLYVPAVTVTPAVDCVELTVSALAPAAVDLYVSGRRRRTTTGAEAVPRAWGRGTLDRSPRVSGLGRWAAVPGTAGPGA